MSAGNSKSYDYNWLARVQLEDGTVEHEYGSEEFGECLADKLGDLTGGELGPGSFLHHNNVSIAYTHLYGFDIEGAGANAALVTRSGEQGSVAELRVPAAAGMLRKTWSIVVGPEVTWKSEATSTDFKSEAEAVTTQNALVHYFGNEGGGATCKDVMWEAMSLNECAVHAPWDKEAGQDLMGDESTGRIIKSGDVSYRKVSTWDILRDPSARSHKALEWIIVREWPNRFDVAATCQTEEQRQAVLSSSVVDAPVQGWAPWSAMKQYIQDQGDRIPVYYLYCKRTASVLEGRQTKFLQDGTILEDGPLDERYTKLPPECIGPVVIFYTDEYRGTPWPYSKFMATLGAGQAVDGLYKDLLTNATACSGPVVSVEDDMVDTAAPTQIGGGPRVIPRPVGRKEPVVLDLKPAHPEHFKLAGTFRNEQQQTLGLDSITAGQQVGENLSGAAMALMTSTSVQNNSPEQASWTRNLSAVGNITLRHIQRMPVPKKIALAGNARSSLVVATSVKSEDVQGVERVIATIGSGLQQTEAGRYTLMETALKEKWVQTPEQAQLVLDTGRYDALTEDLSNELLLIKHENESMAKGEVPPVMLGDNHRLHLKMHRAVGMSLSARRSKQVMDAEQAHEDWHIRILRETDPQILELFGQPALAPAGAPSGTAPPMPGAANATKPPQQQQQEAGPSMPTNPATGEPAKPAAGQKPPGLAVKPGVA